MDACEEADFEDSSDFDLNYEFDAPKFFDFVAGESPLQAEEAERWFLTAESHAPSPLIIKLRWRTEEDTLTNNTADSQNEGHIRSAETPQSHGSTRSKPLPKSSNLLKPTASRLAKLNKSGFPSATRSQCHASPLNHSGDALTSKRQKLETGYLKKAAQLGHQSSFAHKSSKKVISDGVVSSPSTPKVTIPIGPNLQTEQRACRDRCVRAARTGDATKSKHYTFKALPLNKKILEGPLLPQPKKSTPCLPEFREFHLRTSERAMHYSSENDAFSIQRSSYRSRAPIFGNPSEDPLYISSSRSANRKEFKLSSETDCSMNPPTELFSKLSLTSDNQQHKKSGHPMDMKENLPNGSVTSNESSWCDFKQGQYRRAKPITDFTNRPTFTRLNRKPKPTIEGPGCVWCYGQHNTRRHKNRTRVFGVLMDNNQAQGSQNSLKQPANAAFWGRQGTCGSDIIANESRMVDF